MEIEDKKIAIYLTNRCNLSCRHCFLEASPKKNKFLSWKNIKTVLEYFIREGYFRVEFTGGEAIFSPHLKRAILYAKKIGYSSIGVSTNGINPIIFKLTNPKLVNYLVFSLDGANDETHDYIRGSGSFKKFLNNIQAAISKGYLTKIVFTINAKNLDEVPRAIALADKLGVNQMSFNYISFMGNAKNNENLLITPQQWIKTRKQIAKVAKTTQKVTIRFPYRFVTFAEYRHLLEEGYRCFLHNPNKTDIFPGGEAYHCCLFTDSQNISYGHLKNGKFIIDPGNEQSFLLKYPLSPCPAQEDEAFRLKQKLPKSLLPVCVYLKQIINPKTKPLAIPSTSF